MNPHEALSVLQSGVDGFDDPLGEQDALDALQAWVDDHDFTTHDVDARYMPQIRYESEDDLDLQQGATWMAEAIQLERLRESCAEVAVRAWECRS